MRHSLYFSPRAGRLRWPRGIWKRSRPFVKLASIGGPRGQEIEYRRNIAAKQAMA